MKKSFGKAFVVLSKFRKNNILTVLVWIFFIILMFLTFLLLFGDIKSSLVIEVVKMLKSLIKINFIFILVFYIVFAIFDKESLKSEEHVQEMQKLELEKLKRPVLKDITPSSQLKIK